MSVSDKVRYPGPGCVVEFLHGNAPTLALVLEDQSGRLRLYTQSRREVKLAANRLLPWTGPQYSSSLNREEMLARLETHKAERERLAAAIATEEVWELTEGEVEKASAAWFAGLFNDDLNVDGEAAMGHALLAAKTHFRFNPPDFEIFSRETVEKRKIEAEREKARERITTVGAPFFQTLWDIFTHKGKVLSPAAVPEEAIAERLQGLLLNRIADPDSQEDDPLWKQLVKGLPADPFLPQFLAQSWGIIPEHYNYLLDRAGYERGDAWAEAYAVETSNLKADIDQRLESLQASGPLLEESVPSDVSDLPFVSIDPASTKDRDDAFFVQPLEGGGFRVSVAIACPGLCWPFGSPLDKAVQRRSASLYLPEGDEHMLPSNIGWQLFSLDQGIPRAAMVLDMTVGPDGTCTSFTPSVAAVTTAANLVLEDCEAVFTCGLTDASGAPDVAEDNPALPHLPMLQSAFALAKVLQQTRLDAGAVIIERPDPEVRLTQTEDGLRISIDNSLCADLTHLVVGEIMILANASLAGWGASRELPLLYRTQDVGLPKEFCGVWNAPHDIAKVVRSLPPATLEMQPKRHAGLGVAAYLTATSPIRRYADLLNQAQVVSWLTNRAPLLDRAELSALMPLLQARMESVNQVQRFRPRYWKLAYFRQQGDKAWWKGVITDENDAFVTVSLPWAQLLVRGRRKFFEEKAYPGQPVEIRLGKINPLQNEIVILEAREAEEA